VLHPKTVLPRAGARDPLRIKNTFNPQHPGSLVVTNGERSSGELRGVTSVDKQSLVTIAGRGMLGVPGIAARAFAAVAAPARASR